MGLIARWLVLALGITLATKVVDGIRCDDPLTLLIVVVLLSFFNAVVRPILVLFTLPFILLTMGIGLVVINAFLFLLVGRLVEGFHVADFWSAFWGAMIVGVTNVVMSIFLRRPPEPPGGGGQGGGGNGININVSGRLGRNRDGSGHRGGTKDGGGEVIDV